MTESKHFKRKKKTVLNIYTVCNEFFFLIDLAVESKLDFSLVFVYFNFLKNCPLKHSLFSSIRFSSLDSMRKEYCLLPPAGETVSLRYL